MFYDHQSFFFKVTYSGLKSLRQKLYQILVKIWIFLWLIPQKRASIGHFGGRYDFSLYKKNSNPIVWRDICHCAQAKKWLSNATMATSYSVETGESVKRTEVGADHYQNAVRYKTYLHLRPSRIFWSSWTWNHVCI